MSYNINSLLKVHYNFADTLIIVLFENLIILKTDSCINFSYFGLFVLESNCDNCCLFTALLLIELEHFIEVN